ncbi:Hypothetical protein A7982_05978 [Minicystis rosea]|nr:Hypothetical protein A7982_05978 [Minicystis rosea]
MDQSPIFDAELAEVHKNRWILGLAASPILLTFAALFAGIFVRTGYFALTLHPTIFALIALGYVWQRNPWPKIALTPVHADANGLRVGGKLVPRSAIRAGFVLPGRTPLVRIERRRRPSIDLQVGDVAKGRALLRALGLDVSQTVATFRTSSRALSKRRYTLSMIGLFMGAYGAVVATAINTRRHPAAAFGIAGGLLFFGALLAMAVVLLMPTRLSVGADGLALRWFGRERFIGYDDVANVSRYARSWGRSRQVGVIVSLRSGEEVHIPIGQAQWNDDIVAIIEERICEAMSVFHSGGTAGDAALLSRGDRDVADWVASLRAIGSGANADMRTAPLPKERLFRIVESPAAAATDRAAAAVALGGDLDADSRVRLKSAADAIAAPKLRVVLESAAGGAEPAELAHAMAELEAQEAKDAVAKTKRA